MIVFVNTSITTINLIKKNPHFDFEYVFFNKKNKNIIYQKTIYHSTIYNKVCE